MAGYVFEELVARVSVEGTDNLKSKMGEVDSAFDKTTGAAGRTAKGTEEAGKQAQEVGKKSKQAAGDVDSSAKALLGLVASASAAYYGLSRFSGALMSVSGVRMAAEFQTAQFGAMRLAGSSEKAGQMLEQMNDLAASSPFRTSAPELMEYARALLATGDNAEQAYRHVKLFQDVAAGTGQGKEMIEGLAQAASKLRSEPEAAIKQLIGLAVNKGVNIQEVLRVGSNGQFNARNSVQANEILSSMYGPKAFQIITNGLEKMFSGAADAAAKSTFNGIANRIGNNLQTVMEPTGRIILPILSAIGNNAATAANLAESLNRFTGGFAGIAVIFAGAARVSYMFNVALTAAKSSIELLTSAIMRLAGASSVAATANTAAAFAPAILGPYSNVGRPGVVITPPAGGMAGKFGARAIGMAALAGSKIKGIAASPMGAMIGGTALSMAGEATGGAAGAALGGAGAGLSLGSIALMLPIPPALKLGIVAVSTVGMALKGLHDYMGRSTSAAEQTADNTKAMADSLKELSVVMIGGGHRAQRIAGQLQVEYGLQRMMARSMGGIM